MLQNYYKLAKKNNILYYKHEESRKALQNSLTYSYLFWFGIKMKIKKILGLVLSLFVLVINCTIVNAQESASAEFRIVVPRYTQVSPVTSPVLVANITDRTGNLLSPMTAKFKVVTNIGESQTLFLHSNIVTQGGYENSLFEQGGQVYIAFANLAKIPTSQSLANCKMGAVPKASPGIVAYPITSILGADTKFINSKNKYEVYIKNGVSYVSVNIGQNVLQSSFASNDPRGFYQAVLSLTEADI